MEDVFTKNTTREVDFLLDELDLSSEMLAQARQSAKAAEVVVNWVRGDATRFSLSETFDAAICLCEGSLGLLGQSDDPNDQPLAILRNISRSLGNWRRRELDVDWMEIMVVAKKTGDAEEEAR
jgi:SAM-dependent methyltransferase